MARRLIALLPAVAVLAAAAVPAGAATAPVTTTVATGSAITRSVPLSVTTLGIPVQVGALELLATTHPTEGVVGPFARTAVTLLDVGGARFGEVGVQSDGVTANDGASLSQLTAIGPVDVLAANLLAIADDATRTATAALGGLSIDTTVLGLLGLELDVVGAVANVGDLNAVASHTLLLAEVDLSLGALLGDVLDGLPLGTLLDLAGQLGIEVPAGLLDTDDLVAIIDGLIASIADVQSAASAVTDASDTFVAAANADPLADYDAANVQALADSLAALDVVGAPVASLSSLITLLADPSFVALDCGLAAPTALTLADDVAGALACANAQLASYDAAVAALDVLEGAFGDARTALDGALDQLGLSQSALAAADPLGDLTADIEALLADLLDVSLLSISEFGVRQDATAVGGDLAGSSAITTCGLTSISILGQTALPVVGCDATTAALTDAVAAITGVLGDLLDTVGGVGTSGDLQLELFGVLEDQVKQAADGTVTATSVLEVLRLAVPDLTIAPCDLLDGLVCELGLPLDLSLLDTLGDLGAALDEALAAVDTAVDAVDAVNAALSPAKKLVEEVVVISSYEDDLIALVDTLTNALTDLDLGSLGSAQGLTIPGTTIVIDPEVGASHTLTAAAAEIEPVVLGVVQDKPALPNTGGGKIALAVLALAGGALLMRRRSDSADEA